MFIIMRLIVFPGWGKIKHPGNAHNILQQANMGPISQADCRIKNDKSNYVFGSNSNHEIVNYSVIHCVEMDEVLLKRGKRR